MDRRLKVLFIPAWYPSEDNPVNGIFVREHAKAVSLYDDVVVLYSRRASAPIKGLYELSEAVEQGIRTIRVRHRRSPIPKTTYFIYLWSVIDAFRGLVKAGFKPDVIHAHVFTAGVPAVILGKLFHIPVVITELATSILQHSLPWIARIMLRFAMNSADIVLPDSYSLQIALESYRVHNTMMVVPPTVDMARFNPSNYQKIYDIKRVLTVAILHPRKGIPTLLNAIALLRGKRKDFIVEIAGDGPNRKEYEQLAASLKLKEVVRFYGFVSEETKVELMRKCDFFVLPSLWETFGVVLIEAMACGKPVIATARGGPREIVSKEVGILAPSEDPAALAEAIDYMLDHYQGYSPEQIAQYVRERYSYEAVGKQLHSVYHNIIR